MAEAIAKKIYSCETPLRFKSRDISFAHTLFRDGPPARYVKLRFAQAPGMPGTFSPPLRVSYPDMHHGTCVTHVPLKSVAGKTVPGIQLWKHNSRLCRTCLKELAVLVTFVGCDK